MRRKIFNSMYTRFVTFFLGSFLISILILVIYISLTQLENFQISMNNIMMHRVEKIEALSKEQGISVNKACDYLKTDEMNISVSDTIDDITVTLSSDEIIKLNTQKIISRTKPNNDALFFTIAKINNKYVFIAPDIENIRIKQLRFFQRNTIIIPIVLGVIIIIFAVAMVVKPIKEISNASEEVARGNFNVEVSVRGSDEISDLSKNFNLMVKQLSANEYLHKDFVSNVSHEFKTPITSLIGYAKLLKKDNITDDKKQEYIDIIIFESERLSNLSSNLLMLSKLENGVIRYKNDEFSLTEQIRDAILLMQNQWENKNLELDLNLEEVQFIGNRDLMYQVWVNLISNAVKYSKDNGILKIALKKSDRIVINIIDNGIGMTKEEQDKIFLRFYKVDKSRNTSGTGLGLPIAKKIIELHNGTISIQSSIGKGSNIEISFDENICKK